ncbi:AAA family ATPase [Scytonema sp. NUACC26]|uniref:ATP-binding protein n=1 Tax=Scytonema sp. NUACC26 TaxID=3140176 RepID=UPI0034DB7DFD
MNINKLRYCNHEYEWELEPVVLSNLTLLVGASGVGKTQILEAIINLQQIAKGASLNGIEWDVEFVIKNNNYQWKGEFEKQEISPFLEEIEKIKKKRYRVIQEELYRNGKVIVKRRLNEIIFNNNKLPKLSPFQSLIEILREEDIAPIRDGFSKIIQSTRSIENAANEFSFLIVASILSKDLFSVEEIQKSDFPIPIKLGLAYKYVPNVFNVVKERFIDIFTSVEDIKINFLEIDSDKGFSEKQLVSVSESQQSFIYIKEKGVNHWINQRHISSGMLKTLLQISKLYLSTQDTVILIDEFENSLGINCIDVVTDLLLENKNMQFIITSHHPYIINNIPMEYWKIVTRRGGVVTATNAKEFNLGKSRHQAFMQLINLDAYREGITVR